MDHIHNSRWLGHADVWKNQSAAEAKEPRVNKYEVGVFWKTATLTELQHSLFRYDINPRIGGTHKVLHVEYDNIAVIYSCSQVATMKYELGWILTRDPLASPTLVSKGYFKMWMHPKLRECISDCKRFVRVQDSRYRDWLSIVRGRAHSLLQLQPQGAALHRSATGGVVWMILWREK